MEEKKLDINSIVGFLLITAVLLWMLYTNQPTAEEIKAKEAEKELVEEAKKENIVEDVALVAVSDSLVLEQAKTALGAFAYSASLPLSDEAVKVETELLALTFSKEGGFLTEVEIKGFEQFEKGSGTPVKLVQNNNSYLNMSIKTNDNRTLETKDLNFESTVTKDGENQVVSMKLKASENQFLEYRYTIKPNDYMLDFTIKSQGLSGVVNTTKPIDLEWQLKTYRNEKSVSYENRYTELMWEYEDGKDDYINAARDGEETPKDVTYIAYKQHLFTSILLTDKAFKTAMLKSDNLVDDEAIDTVFTKNYLGRVPLAFNDGAINYDMNLYYGPSKFDILNNYDRNLDEVMPLGWGIFGWINRFVFIPLFGFLSTFLPYGIGIIVMTVLVRLVLSPVTYKSYLSQAKMKVIRPEVTALGEKYKNDPMKKQQETMKLYSKAGVNPMAGCIPALLQMPLLYALIYFFPSVFDLRQKNFLWAEDLSSYDSIYQLPFNIPFYGDHISLFPILASVAIFFYMRMTTGDQQMSAPTQEGMPDMGKIMKVMLYISPVMMLFFFNNYASGMSLYYFVSNLITIGIMLVIKNYIIDTDKIHAKIEENKSKPKKEGKFQKKMREMMEQAEAQKAKQNKK